MQQFWLFLRNNSNVFLFLFLEIIAFGYLFTRNNYHQAKFLKSSNSVQAKVSATQNKVFGYFHLQEQNNALADENNRLYKEIARLQRIQLPISDSTFVDTVKNKQFDFLAAEVISNPLNKSKTLLTIDKGTNQGAALQDGVISPLGVVGKVVQSSANYSIVMPLFHPHSKLNVKHKASGFNGNLIWRGANFQTLTVENIPRNARVEVGDTIVTNQYSKSFPEYSMVGVVTNNELDASGNFYNLDVEPATNFFRLNYVYLVQREDLQEILELENTSN